MNYILSGCSYTRITFKEAYEDDDCLDFITDCFDNMQYEGENHVFSLLFNGCFEKNFGQIFKNYKRHVDEIMTDSGGLQIVTQGRTVTPEIKKEVYTVQGKYSNTGLSFDEIPISFSGESSGRMQTSDRWFDPDKFEDCAKLTGENIKNQIQTFLDMDSKTKPIFIAQGTDYETYMKWTEIALKQIPKDHHKYIAGVAMGAASLGTGQLEDIKRAFYFTQLPINTRRLHILGVGAVRRIAPFLVFSQNGLYKDLHISYDSTTHSSGVVMGRSYLNDKVLKFPKEFCKEYETMFDAFKLTPYMPKELTLELFYEILTTSSMKFKEKYGSRNIYIKCFLGFTCFCVSKFIHHMEKCFTNKENIIKLGKNSKDKNVFNSLYSIKSYDDFLSWERNVSRTVKSTKITHKKNSFDMNELF